MNFDFSNLKLVGNEIPWLKDFRLQGQKFFIEKGIPSPKIEEWRYTKPSRYFNKDFVLSYGHTSLKKIEKKLPFDAYYICFENGVFNPAISDLPQGIELVPIIEAIMFKPGLRDKIGKLLQASAHSFTALNAACLNEGVYLHIDSNVNITKPIALVYHATPINQNEMFCLRNLIELDKNSSASIVEYYNYEGAEKSEYFSNVVNEIYVAENSSLNHYKVQDEAFKAFHIAHNAVDIKQSGNYKSFCLQRGADMARNETLVHLSEEGAFAEVNAAYIMGGWATLDTTNEIKHLSPNTKSSQLIKGVVSGQAKGVFQGKIHITPNAIKTEGYQLHKAMLLSDEAEIDVKPELEIFADDVKCSHGSACGELDKEQLFYMRSRGIKEEDAKQLLIDAYLNDVITKIDDEKIAEWIKSLLATSPRR